MDSHHHNIFQGIIWTTTSHVITTTTAAIAAGQRHGQTQSQHENKHGRNNTMPVRGEFEENECGVMGLWVRLGSAQAKNANAMALGQLD